MLPAPGLGAYHQRSVVAFEVAPLRLKLRCGLTDSQLCLVNQVTCKFVMQLYHSL